LECAVLVAVLAPRNALRTGDVSAALARLWQSGRREDLAAELLRAADVHELRFLSRTGLLRVIQKRAQRRVRRLRLVGRRLRRRLLGAEVASFREPLLASAV